MTIAFTKVEHVFASQENAEKAMLREIAEGQFTLEAPYIKVNPYIIAPLTALIYFTTKTPQSVHITVKGKEAGGDFTFDFPQNTEHYIPALGLYDDATTNVILKLEDGSENTLSITTDKAADSLKVPTSIKTSPEYMGQNVVFVSPSSPAYLAAYDYKGDARWYCTLNTAFDFKRGKNGKILVGTNRLLMPPYHTTGLYEMGMIGKIYNEFRIPGGYHHDQFEMEDGNLLILTQKPERGTVEDMCVLVDRKTGAIIKEWDYQTVLPQDVAGSGSQDAHDWFHNNSVWYDKKTNSLTLSGRHQDAVININYDSGTLNWVIGDPEGWPQDLVDKYFFKPVGDVANFDWQYEQHAAVVLPNGDIMCFDNGHYRSKNKENYVPAAQNFSRGVRYRIDTEKMEIEQLWQYGKERGSEFFSTYICNVEYYGEGHYMVHSGGTGSFKGEICNFPPVRELRWDDASKVVLNSITVELKDDEVMYEMQLPANYYRAEKICLYNENDTLSFGRGELLGTLGITESFETIPDVEESTEDVPATYNIKIAQEEDRVVMRGTFEKGQLVMLLLEGDTSYAYFVPTTSRPFMAMCVGTFLELDARSVEFPVSLEGIKGEFTVSIIIDDLKYTTKILLSV